MGIHDLRRKQKNSYSIGIMVGGTTFPLLHRFVMDCKDSQLLGLPNKNWTSGFNANIVIFPIAKIKSISIFKSISSGISAEK